MNFNAIIRKKWKIQGGLFTKLLISQLLCVQECKIWFKTRAKTRHAHKMIQYANSLIHIIKNIDENMRNPRKIEGK